MGAGPGACRVLPENCCNPEPVIKHFQENIYDFTNELIFHAPYNELLPHAIEPLVVDIARKRYRESYELCEKYKLRKMVVHANYIPTVYFKEWFIPKQIEFWKDFLEKNPGHCQLVLENVMEESPDMIGDIVKGVNDPRFKMCLDVGHANLHPVKPMEWLEACAPFISHMHIHNNMGPASQGNASSADMHRALGDGIIDMEAILHRADQLIPEGLTATIESNHMEESAQWLKCKGFI